MCLFIRVLGTFPNKWKVTSFMYLNIGLKFLDLFPPSEFVVCIFIGFHTTSSKGFSVFFSITLSREVKCLSLALKK